jgi:hypothetical protein
MANLKMLNNKIALVNITAEEKKEQNTELFFSIPTVANNLAEVKFAPSGSEELVGKRVYYGKDFQVVKMQGFEALVMDLNNLVAVLNDSETQG